MWDDRPRDRRAAWRIRPSSGKDDFIDELVPPVVPAPSRKGRDRWIEFLLIAFGLAVPALGIPGVLDKAPGPAFTDTLTIAATDGGDDYDRMSPEQLAGIATAAGGD